jgi:hypothetical protein
MTSVGDVAAHDIIWVTVLNSSGFSLCSSSPNKDALLGNSDINELLVKLPLFLRTVAWRYASHSKRQD